MTRYTVNFAKLGVLLLLVGGPAWATDAKGVIIESTTDESVIIESTTDETCARMTRGRQGQREKPSSPVADGWTDELREQFLLWLLQLLLR